jgi:hypothetical protein
MVTYKVTYSIIRLTISLPTSKCHIKSWTNLPLSSLTPALNAKYHYLSLSSRSLFLTCLSLSLCLPPYLSITHLLSISVSLETLTSDENDSLSLFFSLDHSARGSLPLALPPTPPLPPPLMPLALSLSLRPVYSPYRFPGISATSPLYLSDQS